jgi:hypothetical protein
MVKGSVNMPSKILLKTPYNIEAEYHSGIFVYIRERNNLWW